MWSEWWNRFIASDPALRRLRTAARVALAVATTLAVMIPVFTLFGQPGRSVLIGAVVSVNSAQAVRDNTEAGRKITTLLMPLPATLSLTLATTTASLPVLSSALFLVVIFAATYIRRFGDRYFALGIVGFMGYFFSMFLRPTVPQLPYLVLAVFCGALAAYVVRFFLISDNPQGILDRGRRTLRAQVHGLLHAVRDAAEHPEAAQPRKQLHRRSVRLNETALMLESTVQELESVGAAGRALMRQRILDVELAAENLLTPLLRVIDHPSGGRAVPRSLGAFLAVLRTEPTEIREASRAIAERVEQEESADVAMAIKRLGAGLAELASATEELGQRHPDLPTGDEDEGAAEALQEAPEEETGLRRPEVRAAVQVTCATAMAIVLGQLVSPNRWYWAVITAFVVFISANSRGELLVRAWHRTAGTVLGVIAGILVATQVTGNLVAELSVILVCVFLAFYFAGYFYAAMTFFITTMLGTLYGILGVFNASVLETRLLETAVGAAAGVLAAVVVLPTKTHTLVRTNWGELLRSLRTFLRGTGTNISEKATATGLLESVRDIDDRLQQLLNSARPLTNYRVGQRSHVDRSLTIASGCAFYARNLSVALPGTIDMVDEDVQDRFAEWLWALGDAAESLAGESDLDFETAIRPARERSDQLHDIAESLTSGPSSLHRSINLLDRITQTLDDLAKERGRSSLAARAPA